MGDFDHLHMVDYFKYCPLCEHERVKDYVEPCSSCICTSMRRDTRVPLNFKEKEGRK